MIRLASENDIAAVARIYDGIHDGQEQGRLVVGWKRGVYPTAETAKEALRRGELYVAEEDGVVVATAKINQEQAAEYSMADWKFPAPDPEVMVLHTLAVLPSEMGKGHAKRFIAFYEELAKMSGCSCLRLDTNVLNLNARRLYGGLGYREVGVIPCVFNGIEGVRLMCFEKKLR